MEYTSYNVPQIFKRLHRQKLQAYFNLYIFYIAFFGYARQKQWLEKVSILNENVVPSPLADMFK